MRPQPLTSLKNHGDCCIFFAKITNKTRVNPGSVAKGNTMNTKTMRLGLMAVGLSLMASSAISGPISSACNQSSRKAATPSVCACIQKVADQTLRGGDQRRVASFFRDPDKAQDVRMSTRSSDDAFWDRYTVFGAKAEATCQG